MKCNQRLYLTADRKKLVPDGHKQAATLFAVPGDEIPQSAADKFGLVDGGLPEKADKGGGSTKEKKSGSDKEKKGGSDKGGKSDPKDPPGIGSIKGVGPATVEALAAVDIKTVADLAAVDPKKAPEVDNLPPVFDWQAVITAAKELGANTQSDTVQA